MSLFSWLFPTPMPAKAPESSGLSRMEATRPVNRRATKDSGPGANNAQPANRKGERMARREVLYTVVREAMMRAGVLTSAYKFKVLSLDGRGRQFLVMVDLSRDSGSETGRLAEIEAMIAQGAKARHDILVTAVYWRSNEHVAVGDPVQARTRSTDSHPMPLESQPAVLESAPAPLAPVAQVPVQRRGGTHFDPIQADEVSAFKQALAAGTAKPAAAAAAAVGLSALHHEAPGVRSFDGSAKHGPQSYTLLTGFEDTELPDADIRAAAALSGTQYGELN
ncbi:MAG: hypothetical protein ACAH21_03580 [Ramlibacter sp.]|nr:hypothetical protein [Ramlibacter sp.]